MTSGTISLDGQTLEYRRIAGPDPGAPTVVFLHEGLGSVSLWRDFPDRFAAATGCPALIYSRRGYGRSDPLTPPYRRPNDYLFTEALEVLPALLDRFGIAEPILFGHSDGATIALIHAGGAGRPVRAAIIEAPHVFVEPLTLAGIRAAVDSWHSTALPRKLGRHHRHVEGTFRGWSETWLDPGYHAFNCEHLLPGITCPLLVIQGEDDHYGSTDQVNRVVAQVSGPSAGLFVPRCGHTPHAEQTQVVLDAALTFLERNLARPAAATRPEAASEIADG
ncbi:MAG: alpha/beta hydrolase [Rhodospirillaceae bacterium]